MNTTPKTIVLKAVAAIGKKSAEIGCHSASILGFHQPKEPADLKAQLDASKKN
jgi:cyclic lactone autoinducer peptide